MKYVFPKRKNYYETQIGYQEKKLSKESGLLQSKSS